MNLFKFLKSKVIELVFIISFYFVIQIEIAKRFGWDELEHIHSAYLVSIGKAPFKDFFQHHNESIWQLFSFVFHISNNPEFWLLSFKIIGIVFGVINLILIYQLSRHFFEQKNLRILTILVCLLSYFFLQNGFEYRPDNLMFSFVIISLDLIFSQKKYWGILSGLSLGISMVILQKSIIFIPIFMIIILIKNEFIISRQHLPTFLLAYLKQIVPFVLMILTTNLLLFSYYFFNGTWEQYWFFNWTLNSAFDDKFSAIRTISELSWIYYGFLVLLCAGIVAVAFLLIEKFRNKQAINQNILIILILNLYYLILLFTFVRSPYSQYFLPFSLFGSILVVKCTQEFLEKFQDKRIQYFAMILFGILLISPLSIYREQAVGDYGFDRASQDIIETSKLSDEKKQEIPVQPSNIFYNTKKFYWFSEDAQRTIKTLKDEGKVPSSIKD